MAPVRSRALDTLVDPRSVAIIGASDRPFSLGQRAVANLLDHSDVEGRTIHLINRTSPQIRGIDTVPSVLDLPEAPDVAELVVPAAATLPVLRECAEIGVKYAVVFTSGFGEMGPEGKAAEAEMAALARESGMRIYGPNSPGLCNNNARLGLMFSPSYYLDQLPGPIGLATQGGGVGRCFLQAMERGVGVGLWASTGNEVDLTVADFIHYMAEADDIKVIATAMEGIRDGDAFVDACLHAAERGKPVVGMKVGRSEYGARAVASHTGSISGAAEVNSAVFKQVGIIEVDDMDELIDTAALLTRAAPKASPKYAVYGFSGGGCAMASDALGHAGLEMAEFTPQTLQRFEEVLPDYAAWTNPVDATSDILTKPEIGGPSLLATCEDANTDLVVYPFPCDYEELTGQIGHTIVETQAQTQTPIVPIWMSDRLGSGYQALVDGGMLPIGSIRRGVTALRRWQERGSWQHTTGWRPLGRRAAASARRTATEPEAKAALAAAGIPVPQNAVVAGAEDAVAAAERIGYPVVLKVVSDEITHKSDVGGVRVGLTDAAAVREAYAGIAEAVQAATGVRVEQVMVEQMAPEGIDMLVGVTQDPTFGAVLTFGFGGIFVELFADVARRLLPLTEQSARELIAEPRSAALLDGLRGALPRDKDALVAALLAISDFVAQHADDIEELEINPLRVGAAGAGVLALDAVLIRADRPQQPTEEGIA
ncbi:acetate--CoA ligase family protein [Granulicoccus phenolivorans]|uniref:acetate--CoA ligase family protein n=1 Tax=Granulicoccus phenolivorans TaxID=266854 RepID=UPI00047D7988|nr:acetate--CoA ligase family protein [Granulicoccus phenolivorans]